MKTSQILFLSTLYASAHSYMAPKAVGSMPRNLGTPESMSSPYTCDNGAKPSMECVDSTAKPSCDCTCTNGIRFNQTLSTNARESTWCGTCEAEKEQCLVQLAINTALATAREQQWKADFEDASAREQSLQTHLEHALVREEELKSNLRSAFTREQSLKADLEAKLKPYQLPTFTIQKCYFTATKPALVDFYINDAEMTAYKCKHICRGSRFFGLSDGTSCYCGDVLGENLSEADDAVCRVKCGGDGYACGGFGVTRVFRYEY